MSLRNEHLEKLYAFKNKDGMSLRTHDIEGRVFGGCLLRRCPTKETDFREEDGSL